jgi:hypothetical protein
MVVVVGCGKGAKWFVTFVIVIWRCREGVVVGKVGWVCAGRNVDNFVAISILT